MTDNVNQDCAKTPDGKLSDLAAEMRSFAMNMRRDDADARDYTRTPYAEAVEQFADRVLLDGELSGLRRDQAARVMPVVGALLDFWEMMPNDEKDLVRTTPRLACLLDELEAAMDGDGPFTTDELE
jgi:hypothetical protein